MERLSGSDALLWHMERDDSPMHTLKVAVLDPSRIGRQLHLDDVRLAVGSRLGLVPRSIQKVVAAPGFGGRPFWVEDPSFSLADHLDEMSVRPPGGMAELDAVCGHLAERILPRERAPWSLTLVHGLAGGRQAVVVRVHHSVTDGVGALNMFLAATSATPGNGPPVTPAPIAASVAGYAAGAVDRAALSAGARRDLGPFVRAMPRLAADGLRSRRRSKRYRRDHPDLPPFMGAMRTSFHTASGGARVCATATLPLDAVKAVGRASGTTVNGVLHALIAGATRSELLERGEVEALRTPTIATFGIAVDKSDRLGGNRITPTNVALASHLSDPVARLAETSRSCREGVEHRRMTGLEMTGRWAEYGPRVVAAFRALFAGRKRIVVNHLVTANVAGPSTTRWIGDVEVTDWFSFALALNPSNVNITVYSYDGRLNVGMVATPGAMPEPRRFLTRLGVELDVLTEALGVATPACCT